ncbi:hypothetical protein EMPS_09313 [Entomortierella parvispora]|uniref:Uncharacterized protein n=1 Tax=Entomortierella parvispora TaxID=205924 RepID=A0A9P3HHR2_9FUNG|nr:hypothetical protein EMPS_07361 [Entomortierella parvispora]GJJ75408.1 hypothetical protein EMPS_07766 [Entomortierella parvispora]GJJ76954.1 hypothetical protein EMPS_09313 [Entomortierella parvispora]
MKNSSTHLQDYRDLFNFFRDPPNAADLVEGKRGVFLWQGDNVGKVNPKHSSPRFRLLRPKCNGQNQAYILVAVVFLVRRFRELLDNLPGKDKKELFRPSRDGYLFRDWAHDLGHQEPVFQGVTGQAYWSMYDLLLKKYADYQYISRNIGREYAFEPTILFNWVKELSELSATYFRRAFPTYKRSGEMYRAGGNEQQEDRAEDEEKKRSITVTVTVTITVKVKVKVTVSRIWCHINHPRG